MADSKVRASLLLNSASEYFLVGFHRTKGQKGPISVWGVHKYATVLEEEGVTKVVQAVSKTGKNPIPFGINRFFASELPTPRKYLIETNRKLRTCSKCTITLFFADCSQGKISCRQGWIIIDDNDDKPSGTRPRWYHRGPTGIQAPWLFN
jgi:hypothetical protein